MVALKNAAIAMIDALGVKGIWRGPDGTESTRVLDTLTAAASGAYGMRDYIHTGLGPVFAREFGVEPTVTVLSLSDTIIVGAFGHDDPSPDERWGLVDLVCQCAAYVMRRAANGTPPLVYRGAVNFGKMLFWDSFLLGPAIDETSEAYELADGAFIWLLTCR